MFLRLLLPFLSLVFLAVGGLLLSDALFAPAPPPPLRFEGALTEAGIAPSPKQGESFRFRLAGAPEQFNAAYSLASRQSLRQRLLAELRNGRQVLVEAYPRNPEHWGPGDLPLEVRRIESDGATLFDERQLRERRPVSNAAFGWLGGFLLLIGVGLGWGAWKFRRLLGRS